MNFKAFTIIISTKPLAPSVSPQQSSREARLHRLLAFCSVSPLIFYRPFSSSPFLLLWGIIPGPCAPHSPPSPLVPRIQLLSSPAPPAALQHHAAEHPSPTQHSPPIQAKPPPPPRPSTISTAPPTPHRLPNPLASLYPPSLITHTHRRFPYSRNSQHISTSSAVSPGPRPFRIL